MAKQELKTKQTELASKDALGKQVEQTLTVDDNCIPSPQELEQYKNVDPRFIDFFIETTKKEQAFRHDIESKKLKAINRIGRREFRTNWWGMFFAACIMLAGLGLAAFLIAHNKTVVGSIFGGGTLVVAASVFMSRQNNDSPKRKK